MRSSDRLVRLAGRRDSCGNGWNPLHEVHAWFTRLVPSAIVVVTYGAAFVLMPQVLKQAMKTGVVDTIWSGAGVALVTVIGALFLNERRTLGQVGGVAPPSSAASSPSRSRGLGTRDAWVPLWGRLATALAVPGHQVGYRRLIGGSPPSALW